MTLWQNRMLQLDVIEKRLRSIGTQPAKHVEHPSG